MNNDYNQSDQKLRSVAERLNVFQDLEGREEVFDQLSRDLTNNLFILLRAAGLYDLDNQALDQSFSSLLSSISGLYDLMKSPIVIRLNDGNFFVNRRLVKVDFSTFQNTRYLIKIFNFLDVNELSFKPEIKRSDLKYFLTTFVRIVREKKNNFLDIKLPNIEARKLKIGEIHPLLKSESDTERLAAWYATACFVTQSFYKDCSEERTPQHAQLKRTILSLIEMPKRLLPLLGRLDLLLDDPKRGGALFIHSVEATGLVALLSDSMELDGDIRLALSTSALQLFQGWSLLKEDINYYDLDSTHKVFEALESPLHEIKEARNEMIRTLLDLGGVSESVIQRIIITFEAQRAQVSQWYEGVNLGQKALPSRAISQARLYSGGLTRGFLSDLVYGAHLYVHLRRKYGIKELWSHFNQASLSEDIKSIFYLVLGKIPFGAPVQLTNGGFAIVTGTYGESVSEIALVENGHDSRKVKVKSQVVLRPTSPQQVERVLLQGEDSQLSRASIRALVFSHLYLAPQKKEPS
ncbi:MAG: hypothetical protein CMH49_07945 [Myxococcales bacterium]|nr:hypothetical protein [Myxococcales bacterium]